MIKCEHPEKCKELPEHNCFYYSEHYRWTPKTLKMSEQMHAHLSHFNNNDLAVLIASLHVLAKQGDPSGKVSLALGRAHKIASYIRNAEQFVGKVK